MKEIPLQLPALRALYTRVGSPERLYQIVRKFYERMKADLMVGFFFENKDLDLIAKKQSEFLLRAMGASPTYQGKAPADAHEKLPPILTGHFDRRLVILGELLTEEGFSESDVRTWVSFENAFREAIVSEAREK